MTSLPMSSLPTQEVGGPYPPPDFPKEEGRQFLLQAFRSFAKAADSLESSYGMLRSEVARLNGELAASNAGLASSVKANRLMREHLDRIVEGLPCGVLVVRGKEEISLINPEGLRLLGMIGQEEPHSEDQQKAGRGIPVELHGWLHRAESSADEQEQSFRDRNGDECWLAARHAAVKDAEPGEGGEGCVSIFILRDVSEAKRLLREKDRLRREQALAEMSAILAHEIRNPLGSLELFAGLLAGANLPVECGPWVEQVQAGLRTLGAT